MSPLSPFGVRASAGSLRHAEPEGIVLPHVWTPEGVVAAPAANGAQVLHLAIALCVLNDTYREAQRLGIPVSGVAATADGDFDDEWRSTGVGYTLTIASDAPQADIERLLAVVDEVAEIPKALRAGTTVSRRD